MKRVKLFQSGGILIMLMSMLGFASSCKDSNRLMMYGSPNADYKVKATIVDQNNEPIPGI